MRTLTVIGCVLAALAAADDVPAPAPAPAPAKKKHWPVVLWAARPRRRPEAAATHRHVVGQPSAALRRNILKWLALEPAGRGMARGAHAPTASARAVVPTPHRRVVATHLLP